MGTTFSAALSGEPQTKIESLYGLSSDPARIFPAYSASSVGANSGNLGLALGAIINEDQQQCPRAPGGLAVALSADISDGIFDGKKSGTPIPYCSGKLAAVAGITGFQDALSGLAQLQDPQRAFAFGGTGNLLTTNGVADIAVNGMHVYPLAPLAAINTALIQAAPASANMFATPANTALMNVAHQMGTATLLPNGKVLIAGGATTVLPEPNESDYTDLYDPVTNTFAPFAKTARMNVARIYATATLLPSGKVLIAGGENLSADADNSAELYDPVTNTFAPAANTPVMNVARFAATATLLPNGKVLIAGGLGACCPKPPLSSTELYDPATNIFFPGPKMRVSRASATAALLPNGKVLIAGGATVDPVTWFVDRDLSSTELYDPATNTFAKSTPNMNVAQGQSLATLLPSGKVLIAARSKSRQVNF